MSYSCTAGKVVSRCGIVASFTRVTARITQWPVRCTVTGIVPLPAKKEKGGDPSELIRAPHELFYWYTSMYRMHVAQML